MPDKPNLNGDDYSFFKRYQFLMVIVLLLLVIGVGCWYVKKRGSNQNEIRKDDLLRKLNQPSR